MHRRENMSTELVLAIIATVVSGIAFQASLAQFVISRRDQSASSAEQRLCCAASNW
jgi:hypothetical protein